MDQDAWQAAMNNLVPGLESSEYGKMPAAFHANSQKVAPITTTLKVVGEDETRSKPIRGPILPRDNFDGVDSDDETDEESEEEEEEEDWPQVVGDVEIDMREEAEEFLHFSRQTLGINEKQWNDIVQERQNRGGWSMNVPSSRTFSY